MYFKTDKVILNMPCTVFIKSKKHIRDVKITKENNDSIEWSTYDNTTVKSGKVNKDVIEDITYQHE